MMSTTRSRAARSLGALVAAAALLAAAPAPAQAEHRDHDRRGHHRHDDDCDRRDAHAHRGAWHPRRGVHAFHHRRGGHQQHGRAYTCGRCRKHFASYDDLYGHVHHHHRVPVRWLPRVLTQVSFGWTFDL